MIEIGVSLYAANTFVQRMPSAVFWAGTCVITIVVINVIYAFLGFTCESLAGCLKTVSWALTYLLYLSLSTQVKQVIPPPFR